MTRYSIEQRTKKFVKGYVFFCHLEKTYLTNMVDSYWKMLQKYG